MRLRFGKKIDIKIIGSLEYEPAKSALTIKARLPMWIMDVLGVIQIPIHIHDITLQIKTNQVNAAALEANPDVKPGYAYQMAGGFCIGTENNCRMKTCDYIAGMVFMNIDIVDPRRNMYALLVSELSFEKILKVIYAPIIPQRD